MNPRTVLIVDDDQYLLRANERIFKRAGWNTIVANSANEAIPLIPQADVILSDFNMVGGNGDEVLKMAGDTPFVFYTGNHRVQHSYVLLKPAGSENLVNTVEQALVAHEKQKPKAG